MPTLYGGPDATIRTFPHRQPPVNRSMLLLLGSHAYNEQQSLGACSLPCASACAIVWSGAERIDAQAARRLVRRFLGDLVRLPLVEMLARIVGARIEHRVVTGPLARELDHVPIRVAEVD